MKLRTNVIFTGLTRTGISTLFQAVTGAPAHSYPASVHQRHRLHRSYDHISCIDMPGMVPPGPTTSQMSAIQSADVLVLLIDSDTLTDAELHLIEVWYRSHKPIILVQSKITLRCDGESDTILVSYKDRVREYLAIKLTERNIPMLTIYFVDGVTFWDFRFDEKDFLTDLFDACGCDGSITPRKEQIMRRGHSKIPPKGIMAVVTFETESKLTRAQFIKWWFPSPLPLEFLLYEMTLVHDHELTVEEFQSAIFRKGVNHSDFILILATESLLYDEGREVTKKLVQACRECKASLPACMIVSVVMPLLSPKVADTYPTSFMETVQVTPFERYLTPIQQEIIDRINSMHTSRDSILLILNRALAILKAAQLFVGPGETFLNAVAHWYTHYSTTYLLTVSYLAAMMGFSSILVSLMLW